MQGEPMEDIQMQTVQAKDKQMPGEQVKAPIQQESIPYRPSMLLSTLQDLYTPSYYVPMSYFNIHPTIWDDKRNDADTRIHPDAHEKLVGNRVQHFSYQNGMLIPDSSRCNNQACNFWLDDNIYSSGTNLSSSACDTTHQSYRDDHHRDTVHQREICANELKKMEQNLAVLSVKDPMVDKQLIKDHSRSPNLLIEDSDHSVATEITLNSSSNVISETGRDVTSHRVQSTERTSLEAVVNQQATSSTNLRNEQSASSMEYKSFKSKNNGGGMCGEIDCRKSPSSTAVWTHWRDKGKDRLSGGSRSRPKPKKVTTTQKQGSGKAEGSLLRLLLEKGCKRKRSDSNSRNEPISGMASHSEGNIHRSTVKGYMPSEQVYDTTEGTKPVYLFHNRNGSIHFSGVAQRIPGVAFSGTSNVQYDSKRLFKFKRVYINGVPYARLNHVLVGNDNPVISSPNAHELLEDESKKGPSAFRSNLHV